MPTTPTYPGVYIEEIPSGVRTITGVGTSVAAFVDFFPRGPFGEAARVFSQADFDRTYGGLHPQSEASYAVQQFFLNGGGEAWVVRCAPEDKGTTARKPESTEIAIRSGTSGNAALKLRAASPGEWGNALRARVDGAGPTTFDLTISEVSSEGVVLNQEMFRGLSLPSASFDPNEVRSVVNNGSQLVRVPEGGAAQSTTAASIPQPNGTFSGPFDSFTPLAALTASNPGRRLNVKIGELEVPANLGIEAIGTLQQMRDRLQGAIRAARPDRPAFAQATVEIRKLPTTTNQSDRLRVLAGPGKPSDVVAFSQFEQDTTATDLKLNTTGTAKNVQSYTNGAAIQDTGQAVGTTGTIGTPPDAAALQAALQTLKDVGFNLLCIPRTAEMPETERNQIIASATAYCEQRRSFFLVDVPREVNTVQEATDWLDTVPRSRNAAAYFPRVQTADPLSDFRLKSRGASGTMAGVYARTDGQRGVWKAPAGLDATLLGVQGLDYVLNDAENGALNPLGLNAIRTFPVFGTVAWGARTLRGADALADEYKYVPVRRLALMIEESLYRGNQWVVFEPNDEPLWAQIRLNVGAFLQNLFRQGAFQGKSPREAYFVKCDKETTTQNDVNLGVVNVVVGFAPLKPTEFVIIKLQQMAGQIEA